MAFCRYLTVACMMHGFPGTIFSLPVLIELLYYNNILISMKKDAEHISDCKSYFPTTQFNGFTYVMSKAAVPSFPSKNCSEDSQEFLF